MPSGIYQHRPHTEAWKKANSERMKGKKHSLGYKHTDEWKQKASQRMQGEKHPNWKGGLTEKARQKRNPGYRPSFKKGHSPWNNGLKGFGTFNRGKKGLSGDKSPNWKGGLSLYRKAYNYTRTERLRNAEGSHTQGEWETLKAQYGFRCPKCGKHEPEIKLTRDHIIPISKGGSNYIENIQPLCGRCNSQKYNRLIGRIQITT